MVGGYGALSEKAKGKEKVETVEASKTISTVEGQDKPSAAGGPSPDDIEANASRNTSSVPAGTEDHGKRFYEPRAVAIGPCHGKTGDNNFRITYEHKSWCAKHIIGKDYEQDRGKFLGKVKDREQEALDFCRKLYGEDYPKMDPESFLEMLMLDSCFILFVLSWAYDSKGVCGKLPKIEWQLVQIMWALELIKTDLLLLNNQIPFSIIDDAFNEAKSPIILYVKEKVSVIDVALGLFDTLGLGRGDVPKYRNCFIHLLELYHLSLTPRSVSSLSSCGAILPILQFAYIPLTDPQRFIPSATELRQKAAESFKVAKMVGDGAQSVLDITTGKYCGDIQMPTLYVYDHTDILLHNLIKFEQPYGVMESHVTAYVAFMDHIVRKEEDVELLEESGVLEHRLTGGPAMVLARFRQLHDVIDRSKSPGYLYLLYENVIIFYESKWRRRYADAKQLYCSSVWLSISFVVGMALSILTLIETIYAIIGFYKS